MSQFSDELFNLVFFPDFDKCLEDLSVLAEPEDWNYQHTSTSRKNPILYNYIQYTYTRLVQENKLQISNDGQYLTFNTGLVTVNQEPIFALCNVNRNNPKAGAKFSPWFFIGWKRKGEHDLQKFDHLPEMAHYFDDPSDLVFDCRKELISNIEHIISDNKDRFPEPYKNMPDYTLQIVLKGAIDNAKERVRRNYKTAIPHFYRNKVQLLLPLCLSKPGVADLAIVVESNNNSTYRAATCLTLDMAYNNARQLARPDRDWLIP